jgi:hypothetical protein
MESLTNEEIDFLLGERDFTEQEWEPNVTLTAEDKRLRRLYAKIRARLVRKGLIKITKKGYQDQGGYVPTQWGCTPFGDQVSNWLFTIEAMKDGLSKIKHRADVLMGRLKV